MFHDIIYGIYHHGIITWYNYINYLWGCFMMFHDVSSKSNLQAFQFSLKSQGFYVCHERRKEGIMGCESRGHQKRQCSPNHPTWHRTITKDKNSGVYTISWF